MYPYLDLSFIKIPLYGVMIATAYLVSSYYLIKKSKKAGFDRKIISDLIFFIVVGGFIGAKILYIITFFNYFGDSFIEKLSNIFSFDTLKAGFVFYGGFLGGFISAWIFVKKKGLNFWKISDFFAPAIALAHSIGRLGCFFAGCCHGGPTDSIFGVRFTNPMCEVNPQLLGEKIHPTQLYESSGNFLIFVILNFVYYKKKLTDGGVILLYIILYSGLRFTVEFFRGDDRGGFLLGFSQGQIISVVAFIISLTILIVRNYGRK
ncbi:MAG: prolipoprotein diacylglyceryl transferase [Elusimicrobiota bacterium]